jgi:hypothetical protein
VGGWIVRAISSAAGISRRAIRTTGLFILVGCRCRLGGCGFFINARLNNLFFMIGTHGRFAFYLFFDIY